MNYGAFDSDFPKRTVRRRLRLPNIPYFADAGAEVTILEKNEPE